ncbi:MAG: diguanylate cyclase [Campylobacterota bacterium]|nr:diguanylate cyclase [Campylobacterota bacterium]
MGGSIRKRRDLSAVGDTAVTPGVPSSGFGEPASDLEVYAKEVLAALISDNLPPTPNNFSLYFDRILEDKSESLRKQINNVLELEEDNDDEQTISLEKNLKQGFSSIKNILQVSANLYKNTALMTKILEKRKGELENNPEMEAAVKVITALETDVDKLSGILKKQNDQMKTHYDSTASIVKSVESTTIFDNQFGVYNKRYLLSKLEQERSLIKEFKHKSSLVMIRLAANLKNEIKNDKAAMLMTRTIARLLLKTSRRSDLVAHYGNGVFAMVLKHTDIASAESAGSRLCDLVSSSNFFLAEQEIKLQISVGVKNINTEESVESIVVATLDAMETADKDPDKDFVVSRDKEPEGEQES